MRAPIYRQTRQDIGQGQQLRTSHLRMWSLQAIPKDDPLIGHQAATHDRNLDVAEASTTGNWIEKVEPFIADEPQRRSRRCAIEGVLKRRPVLGRSDGVLGLSRDLGKGEQQANHQFDSS